MDIRFDGKRILVTGAGRGIGREVVKALYNGGATVIALTKTAENLQSLKEECPNIVPVCVDISDWNATRAALKNILPVDGLVNNAGYAECDPFLESTPESFDRVFSVNVKAVLNVSQVAAEDMIARKTGGAIVHISSQASMVGLQNHVVYCASKGAVDSMCRVMALELGPHKIRVNCVNPTVVMTDMGRVGWSDPAKAGPMLAKIPLGRFAEIEDVVGPILYLLSDKAAMINGVILPVDGGFTAT